jgi:hypothetical protein
MGYKLVETGVAAPLSNLVKGALVLMDHAGKRGKWIDGDFYSKE